MSAPVKYPLRQRARKAFGAAGTAMLATAIAALSTAGELPRTQAGWVGLVSGIVSAGVVAWITAFSLRNAGTVNGSEVPAHVAPVYRRP